jgi:ribosomal protein L21E
VRNPKSNGVIERVHLTMCDMLRTTTFSGADWFGELQHALDAVAWAVRTTVNPLIKHSPCHLAFSQDMVKTWFIIVPLQSTGKNVHLERHKSAAASNEKENRSRNAKHYQPGDSVLIVLDPDERRSHPKMSQPTKGPYIITKVNTNGMVEINRGSFNETINIRRLKPFNIW